MTRDCRALCRASCSRAWSSDDVDDGHLLPCDLIEVGRYHGAPALVSSGGAGMIDEHAPHDLSSQAVELLPVLEAHARLSAQANPRFVNDRRGLQRVPALFAMEIRDRDAFQLAIDERNQRIEHRLVAIGPPREQQGDVVC